ncbi:hypothetical protein [Nocardia higoensis]|uniref:hypothetical protein n=1 Tax=Nocardia higoensis TaxID=228599 RepID=UPI0003094BE9|nr:hypothetical protein [Nocardia higoensis]
MHEGGSPSDPADEFGGSEPDQQSGRGSVRVLTMVVAAALIVAFFAVLGVLNPPRDLGVRTDRLGPENAERVSDYLARAANSLNGTDSDEHWALLSFTEPLPPDQLTAHTGGLRIGQVLYQVPLPRVRTPLTTIPVPANETAVRNSASAAAGLMRSASTGDLADERYRRILEVSANRLEAGCACAVAVVVRGPLDRLRQLSADPAIRAVQALPADAVAGHYGVAPLLPEHTDAVLPGPDDGPVPDN